MKNSGLAKLISSGNVFSICTSQFHPPKKWPQSPEAGTTCIKDGFEEMEHEFPFWNIPS